MIYVKRSDGVYATFDGMSEETITEMLSIVGITPQFIDKTTYDAAVASTRTQ